ncbi:MAG: hypothetical protein JRI23_31010 [Deltaproteobacteria bacterium]|jgi:hypothetical protein|nr:hypothetical protein [Deltaproteobacteria bacterium]MBW2536632.1 hypothetical protein [Deltaproteobacteria bacterium]
MDQWASWYDEHHYRMVVFSPFFDDKLTSYPRAWDYFDLYAIYAGSQLLTDHPEWVLRDADGNMLFIPWGCSGGTCPQYAGDISSTAFRSWWIDEAKVLIDTKGYRGLWIDDVNLDFRVGNGDGDFVAPIDPNTGTDMTEADWRKYMAEFTELIRTELPTAELCHNSIWYAGGAERHDDPFIQRQVAAADYLNIEHGIIDGGITGGTGSFSVEAMLRYIDAVHGLSRKILLEGFTNEPAMLEYSLAFYFLVTTGQDALGHHDDASPENWWSGHDVNLGAALGPRQTWNGLRRRDFAGGMVLVNEPGAPESTADLPGPHLNLAGETVTSVTLGPKSGAVLRATDN